MYFIEIGLGKRFKPLAMMFAFCDMFGCLAIFQFNQLTRLLDQYWGISPSFTGCVAMLIVGTVILGSITRVGRVTSAIVPSMCLYISLHASLCFLYIMSKYLI